MQHSKQSAWLYTMKTHGFISWKHKAMLFKWMNILTYLGGKPREAVCIIICLIIQIKIAENLGALFKKGNYQMIVLSIVALDICLLETFPLGWDNPKWTADKLRIQSCDTIRTLVRRCYGRNLDDLDIFFFRLFSYMKVYQWSKYRHLW